MYLSTDASTAGGRVLRWRMAVRGNSAVEFGVVPEALHHFPDALHTQMADPQDESSRAVGFCSNITAGSSLPYRVSTVPLIDSKGSTPQVIDSNCSALIVGAGFYSKLMLAAVFPTGRKSFLFVLDLHHHLGCDLFAHHWYLLLFKSQAFNVSP